MRRLWVHMHKAKANGIDDPYLKRRWVQVTGLHRGERETGEQHTGVPGLGRTSTRVFIYSPKWWYDKCNT